MRSLALSLVVLLSGCATQQDCQRDYTQPMQIAVPVNGILVVRTVYPCR